jgi:fimbrial isopeptide formation D2 family protein
MKSWIRLLSHSRAIQVAALPLAAATMTVPVRVLAQTVTCAPGAICNTATAGSPTTTLRTSNPTVITVGNAVLELVKTGDRQAAEPGDTVIYRLLFTNPETQTTPAALTSIEDNLPKGLNFKARSLKATLRQRNGVKTNIVLSDVTTSGRGFTAKLPVGFVIAPGDTLDVIYAAEVTADAIQGSGRNVAVGQTPSGPTNTGTHQLRIRPGILADCGTLLGRVFQDKNNDGEQQVGEPGIPYAVVFMDDGNRITTDDNGLFSVANVLNGMRVGTLDLTSVPGYKLADNKYRIDRNSLSRMVRLAPGTTGRMNFAVEPLPEPPEEPAPAPRPRPVPAPRPAPIPVEPAPAPAPKPRPAPKPIRALF